MKKLYTIEELSEYLSIKESTIYQWTHLRKIPYIKVGRFLRFDSEEIDDWVAGNSVNSV